MLTGRICADVVLFFGFGRFLLGLLPVFSSLLCTDENYFAMEGR